MIGLQQIPSQEDLLHAYRILQSQPGCVSIADLVLWAQWVRFDPRLGEQWAKYLEGIWQTLSPVEINMTLKEAPWAAAAGPLFEIVYLFYLKDKDLKPIFKKWFHCAMSGISPARGEQYFMGLRAFGGALMQQDVTHSIRPFQRWGYFGRELLINKAQEKLRQTTHTLLPASVRRAILDELICRKRTIRSQDYIDLLEGGMSRRQAELDLAHHPKLIAVGQTRGRFYKRTR